jgi:hypothetical protein
VGQGCKLDAVGGKETDNVVCSDVFAVTNVLDVRDQVHDQHQSLCYGEDRGEKIYSVEIVCIGGARFRFDKYDTEVRFEMSQVIFDIDAIDKCRSVLFFWKCRWWDRVYGIIESIPMHFAADVPAVASAAAAVTSAAIAATGFAVFCYERVKVPDAFGLT